jgi:hypothetical protein
MDAVNVTVPYLYSLAPAAAEADPESLIRARQRPRAGPV